ncbi:hypothetical protein MASR2M64_12170 [Candidatus Cloacimonadota bacterium]
MLTIKIISTLASDTEQILSAFKFFPFTDNVVFELHCLDFEKELTSQAKYLQLINHPSTQELFEQEFMQGDTVFFNRLSTFLSFSRTKQQLSPTLFVHPDIAILEIPDPLHIPAELIGKHNQYCMLQGDLLLTTLPKDIDVRLYEDINLFHKQKQADDVLVTSNHNLVLTLVSIDKANWLISHPELNAHNLALELWEDAFSHIFYQISHAQKQITEDSYNSSKPLDLAAIRRSHNEDKHAYSFFANHYDEYMAHVDYDLWVKRIIGWHKQYTVAPLQSILEVACGTANVSNRLVLQGYHVDASDLSAEMLHVADQKPLKPNLYQASLTDPIPVNNYDLILCMFDSVNYLTRGTHFIKMLEQAYNALAVNGLFIFDISTRFNSEENFADICNLSHHKEGYLVHQAWYDPIKKSQNSSLTSFKKDFIAYSQQYELHQQRVYLCADLISLILKSNFKLKAIHSSESKLNFYPRHIYGLDDKYSRLFFILKKEAN